VVIHGLIDQEYVKCVDIMVDTTKTGNWFWSDWKIKYYSLTCTKKANTIYRSFAGGVPESHVHIDMIYFECLHVMSGKKSGGFYSNLKNCLAKKFGTEHNCKKRPFVL